ncbi:vacuolar protein sorting-associated protein 54, chloroplastic-like isoform X1 [Olea europaea var. sylvestris]|uniref:vacuolar protein sorting-associated protein 54, chloroplastic-like isoform X1 n=1 Tax=Olea europaea var. sylvestris TaxID=158386 RepID=UPI000C1CF7D8|nr:vacuolar protein sorting-associated protein 54, chloroplastic-like isoform X1 [Olea europaea var. sylvestris]
MMKTNIKTMQVRLEEERIANFQDQLLPLIIGLLRTGKLPAVLRIYRDTLASEIKTSVKQAVEKMHLELDSVSGDGMVDADGGGSSLGTKLKSLSPDGFLKLLEEVFMIVQVMYTCPFLQHLQHYIYPE